MIDAAAMAASPVPLRTAARPHCLLCGSAGTVLHAAVADHYFRVPGRWTLKRCPDPGCGLVWQDPMLVAEDIGRAYESYYCLLYTSDAADE